MRSWLLCLLVACGGSSGESPDASVPDASQADASPPPCELLDSTGCEPDQKCTLDFSRAQPIHCGPLYGSLGALAPDCNAPPDYHDQCGRGLFCFAGYETELLCRPFCHVDGDCTTELDRCLWYLAGPPKSGYCARSCVPFAGDCPQFSNCSRITPDADDTTYWAGCRRAQSVAVGQPCGSVGDCVPDADCWFNTCRALCDAQHACTSGSCQALPGLPNSAGLCL